MKLRFAPLLLATMVTFLGACTEEKKPAPVTSETVPAVTSAAVVEPAASASAAPREPERIAAQHVLVAWKGAKGAPKTVSRTKADAKKRAEEVLTKAKGGGDFSALVAEYSDDLGSKDRQGSLGKFNRESKVKAFADVAFALGVDQISEPVETDFGFHVIKRNQ